MVTGYVEVTCDRGIATVVCLLCEGEFVTKQGGESDRKAHERVAAHLGIACRSGRG